MGFAFLHLFCASVWAGFRWLQNAACLPLSSALWTIRHAGSTGHCRTGLCACRASRPLSWRLMSGPARCDRYAGRIVPYIPESLPAADAGEYATSAADFSCFSCTLFALHTSRSGDPYREPLFFHGAEVCLASVVLPLSGAMPPLFLSSHTCRGRYSRAKS